MKKCIAFLLALAVILGLSACKATTQQKPTEATQETTEAVSTEVTAAPTEATSAPTEMPTGETDETSTVAPTDVTADITVTTEAPTAAATEAPTEEPHSEFYVAGVSLDEMVTYFNEIVLGVEQTAGGGDAAWVQKWDRPIAYRIDGAPSQQDGQTINALAKQLNEVEGFPGIYAATGLEQNVTIYFLREAEFKAQFSHLFDAETEDSVVQFWLDDENNSIYSGRIGYCKDTPQETRDSVIPKELLSLLGFSNAVQREVSTDDQEESDGKSSSKKDSETTVLNDLDLALVKLLYNPRIQCGMNAAECEAIIRELYY